MTDPLADLTDALLQAARRAGADSADAIAISEQSVSVDVRDGALEHAERSEGTEVGLRVLMGRRQACVSASDTRPDTLTEMAQRAVAMAREAPEDPCVGLADPGQLARTWDVAALDLVDPATPQEPDALKDAAQSAESAALAVEGITKAESASATTARRAAHLAATNGFSGGYARTVHSLSCVAITGSGTEMERDYFGDVRLHRADLMSPDEIGRLAAARTLARAGARQPKTGQVPVLFDERIASSLIGHLLAATSGTSVARGASWLRDAEGQQVLPEGLDLVEDPLRPRALGSRPFDVEGLPCMRRKIVDNGVLTGWTLDLGTARKLGRDSTASAARGPSGPPSPSVSNVALTQGDKSQAELMADMGTGLLVTSMIGATINPTTGDYSRGASGMWIENGAPVHAVNECTLAGNLRDMLRHIVPANDARPHLSRVVPSLLVEGLTLAGA